MARYELIDSSSQIEGFAINYIFNNWLIVTQQSNDNWNYKIESHHIVIWLSLLLCITINKLIVNSFSGDIPFDIIYGK